MKKLLPLFTTLLISNTLEADLVRIHGGGGAWNQNPSGTISDATQTLDVVDTLGYTNDTNIYLWAYVKHFIPFVPNVRVEAFQSHFSAKAKSAFSWNNTPYSVGSLTRLDIKQYDATLYYNILDNTLWSTIDLGIDFKQTTLTTQFESDTISDTTFILPLLYARARVEIPTTGIALEVDAKAVSFESASLSDLRAKIHYTFDTPVLKPGVELGYRQQRMNLQHSANIPINYNIDIAFDGLFGGITLAF